MKSALFILSYGTPILSCFPTIGQLREHKGSTKVMVKRVKKAFRATIFTLPVQSCPYKLPQESECRGHTHLNNLDGGRGIHTAFHNIQQISIIERLLLIGHSNKTIISNLQLFSIQAMTKLAQASIQT